MKRVLIFICLLISFASYGQVKQEYNQYGGLWKRLSLRWNGGFQLPRSAVSTKDLNLVTLDTAQLYYNPTDSSLYYFTGFQAIKVATGSGIDTSNKWVNWIQKVSDSIIFWIGSTRYAIKDSSATGGIDDVLAVGQQLSANRQIDAAAHTLTIKDLSGLDIYSNNFSGSSSHFAFPAANRAQMNSYSDTYQYGSIETISNTGTGESKILMEARSALGRRYNFTMNDTSFSFGSTGGGYLTNFYVGSLPTGAGTKALRVDDNGKFFLADTTISGGGTSNANAGSGYRVLKPGSQEIKTLFNGYAVGIDSSSNTDGLTFKVDTGLVTTKAWHKKGIDSVAALIGTLPSLDTIPNPKWRVVQDAGGTTYKSTAPSVYYATDFGVVADGSTDDWAALDSALRYVNAAGGGDLILPLGKMMVSRVLRFPLNPNDSSQSMRSIRLMGQMIPNMFSDPLSSHTPTTYGSIIQGTFLGDSAVIDATSSTGSWGDFTFLNVTIENLDIRVRSMTGATHVAAQGQGINAYKIANIQIRNVAVRVTSDIALQVEPASTSAGIIFPAVNNFVMNNGNNIFVTGFYKGVMLQEHGTLDNYFADGVYYGIYFNTGHHSMHVNKACIARYKYAIGAGADARFTVDNVSLEASPTSGTWWQTTLDMDAHRSATGTIHFQRVQTNLGRANNEVFNRSNVPYNITVLPLNETTPKWATANRPDSIPAAATIIGFNTDSSFLEVYNHGTSSWDAVNKPDAVPDYRDQDLGVSLKVYYDLEESSGVFTDKSGNGKDLTRFGSVPTVTGKINNGAEIRLASSQYLRTSSGSGLSAGSGITFTCWVKLYNTADTYMVIAQKGTGGAFNFEYNCYQFAGNVYWQMSTDGTNGGIVSVNRALLRDSLWHFICGKWNGATLSLQVDNGTAATASMAAAYTGTSTNLYLGAEPTPSLNMTGLLDEVGIWNTQLTTGEIDALYNSGTGRTIGLTGGGILFAGTDGLPDHDLQLNWDNTNKILGLATAQVTTQFDKTSNTTLADVTGLTKTLTGGHTYRFEARLYTTSNSSGGVKFAIAGTATATTIIYEGLTTDAGTTTQSRGTALATAVGAVTAVTAAYTVITGTIKVNAGGTITVQFAQNASNGTASSVLVGSTFTVTEIL